MHLPTTQEIKLSNKTKAFTKKTIKLSLTGFSRAIVSATELNRNSPRTFFIEGERIKWCISPSCNSVSKAIVSEGRNVYEAKDDKVKVSGVHPTRNG